MQHNATHFRDIHQLRLQRLESQYREAEDTLATARSHYHRLREMPLQSATAMSVAMLRIHSAVQALHDLDESIESVRKHEPVA